MEGLKNIFEIYRKFCEYQTEKPLTDDGGCDNCPAADICNMGLYEKALKELKNKSI